MKYYMELTKILKISFTLIYFNSVVTAGHIIYSHDNGGWTTEVEVTPAMKYKVGDYKNAPLGSAKSRRLTTNNAWIQNKEWDWGVIDLDSSFQTWQLFANGNGNGDANREIMTIGYPGDKPDAHMYYDIK